MKPNFPIVDVARFEEKLRAPMQPIVQSFKRINDMLNGQLSIADNLGAAVIQVDCTHNTEALIPKNILRGTPAFFQPLYTTVSRTDPTPALPVACTPQPLNHSRTDSFVGMTLRFAPPSNMLGVTKNANQTGVVALGTLVTWQTTEYRQGTFAYTGAGVFTMPESGFVRVSCDIIFNGSGAAGDGYGIHVANTITGKRYAQARGGISTGTSTRFNASDEFPVTAGDTYGMYMNQVGTLRDVLWTSTSDNTRLGLSYVAPSTTYAATVTGILWGG